MLTKAYVSYLVERSILKERKSDNRAILNVFPKL